MIIGGAWKMDGAVAALAIERFRSGPASDPTTWPQEAKWNL